jgi:hypothetical protein
MFVLLDRLALCVGRASICAVLLAAIAQPITAHGGQDALEQRFLSEAPQAWREYEDRAQQLQGRYGGQTEVKLDFHSIGSTFTEFKGNSQCKLLVVTSEKVTDGKQEDPYQEVAYGVNPRYAFEVRRDAVNGDWFLSKIIDLSNEELPAIIEHLMRSNGHMLSHLSYVWTIRLADLVQSPGFRVTGARPVRRDGEELVEVTFESPHEATQDQMSPIQAGVLVLDPGRYWCLREYEVKQITKDMDVKKRFRITEFVSLPGSIPAARRIVIESSGTIWGKPFTRTDRWEYNLAVPAQLPPDEEFALPAFGLPEPPQFGAGRANWYLLAALLGLGCLGLGGLLLRLRRRPGGPAPA